MKGARLAVLWHLHQPDYRDPATGRPTMPWVRMHALRGYRDLWVELAEVGAAMTVNVVPSLLDQLLHYASGGTDDHLDLVRIPADALTPPQAAAVARELPGGHDAMARPHPAWWRLKQRALSGESLSTQDLRDVQVWSVLQWFGATACRDFGAIGALRARGHGYSEAHKEQLLAVQDEVLRGMPGILRRFVEAEGPCLSTSPYFHPILPLLVDARHARRCMPSLPDEGAFAWPEDASRQLVSARERVQELTGVAPKGLWPSEGSVSPEVVELAAAAGFEWLASDGEVLQRSERDGTMRHGPWRLTDGLKGFFREHELSDRIGFHYAMAPAEAAAADLLGAVGARAEGGVVTVALDGENPWESFEDAGAAFRRALYRRLADGPVRAITLDDASRLPAVGRVRRLHTGSWIGADFHIWIGHPLDRAAWNLLADVRRAVDDEPRGDRREAAMAHVLAAEGSDWTWWYGEDFETRYARHFDALFRSHVAAAWRALGQPVPREVGRPLTPGEPTVPPTGFVTPQLGEPVWLDWVHAGRRVFREGAMAKGGARVRELRYGWDRSGALWLAVRFGGALGQVAVLVDDARVELDQPGLGAGPGLRAHRGPHGVVVQAVGRGAAAVSVEADGASWGPVTLEAPAHPALSWWTA